MYNFELIEKGHSKGCFIRVHESKLNISRKAIEMVGMHFDVYTDKKSNALMLVKNENGRTATSNKASFTVCAKTGMELGRYFYSKEKSADYGGFVFVKS